jgi:hypothetical protein
MTFILLDADAIRDHILPDLVRRHFGDPDENAFAFWGRRRGPREDRLLVAVGRAGAPAASGSP